VSTLERAIAIAVEAHAGQIDKAGGPYILHPLRVMLSLGTDDERIVGVLHDVCEDCPGWNFDRLRREGFSEPIIAALTSVTKIEGEPYEDFVLRAARNPIGRSVKHADLVDNSDISRIAEPTARDHERLASMRWHWSFFASERRPIGSPAAGGAPGVAGGGAGACLGAGGGRRRPAELLLRGGTGPVRPVRPH